MEQGQLPGSEQSIIWPYVAGTESNKESKKM